MSRNVLLTDAAELIEWLFSQKKNLETQATKDYARINELTSQVDSLAWKNHDKDEEIAMQNAQLRKLEARNAELRKLLSELTAACKDSPFGKF